MTDRPNVKAHVRAPVIPSRRQAAREAVSRRRQALFVTGRVSAAPAAPPAPAPTTFHSLAYLRELVGSICASPMTQAGLNALADIFDPCAIPLSDAERCGMLADFPVVEHALQLGGPLLAHQATLLESMARTAACAAMLWSRGAQTLLAAANAAPQGYLLLPAFGELLVKALPAPDAYAMLPQFLAWSLEDGGPRSQEAFASLLAVAAALAEQPSLQQRQVFAQLHQVCAHAMATAPWKDAPDSVYMATSILVEMASMRCAVTAEQLVRDGLFQLCEALAARGADLAEEAVYICQQLLAQNRPGIVLAFLHRRHLSTFVLAAVAHPDRQENERYVALQAVHACFPRDDWPLELAYSTLGVLQAAGAMRVFLEAFDRMELRPEDRYQFQATATMAAEWGRVMALDRT